jgi:hypothetical protein
VTTDYCDTADAPLWFRGPFRTWRQFAAFCDHLVASGILRDDRQIFFDYDPDTGDLVVSPIQQDYASQALADLLKANFNPNLMLNELNPDANLFLRVDKTDLMVNSTEFCFTPMGYFEVESVGRVLRPIEGSAGTAAAGYALVAEAKARSVAQLFTVTRASTQGHFSGHTLSPRVGSPVTNNNKSIEVGPDLDLSGGTTGLGEGPAEWGGYIAFPTVGGPWQGADEDPVVGGATPPGTSSGEGRNSILHSHFYADLNAHHHAGGDSLRNEAASSSLSNEWVENAPDPGEELSGPYGPSTGEFLRYRLARSFRRPPPGETFAGLTARAPADLRVDGAYSERHAAPAYLLSACLPALRLLTRSPPAPLLSLCSSRQPSWYLLEGLLCDLSG